MSLRTEPWWSSCLDRIAVEPLEALAAEFGVEVEVLAGALATEGRGRAAQEAPWWPEAVRELAAGASIRAVARRFGTEPRRIRRALARDGRRAAGVDAGADGFVALEAYTERLGQVPDAKVAAEAQVPVEAVQGERRRRGVEPYRQRRTRRPKLTEEDLSWIRGPKRNRREKFKPEAEVQVVRRPVRTETPPPVMIRRSVDTDRGHFEATPREVYPRAPRREEERRPYERPWIKSEREVEIEQLLSVQRRQREGRQRIVRQDVRPEPVEPERTTRPARRGTDPTWRAADEPTPLGVIRRSAPEPVAAPVPRVAAPAPVVEAPSATAPATVRRRMVDPATPAATVRRRAAPAAEPAGVSWNVLVPGAEEPLVVVAIDIAGAIAAAAELVAPDLLARAAVWRADLPRPE